MERKKQLAVAQDDVRIEDGRLIITSGEVVKAIEDQEFSLDNESSNALSCSIKITKT
jgi:hypothetical protein